MISVFFAHVSSHTEYEHIQCEAMDYQVALLCPNPVDFLRGQTPPICFLLKWQP